MGTKSLPKVKWRDYFDQLSKEGPTQSVNVEVLSEDLGDQQQIHNKTLVGISYDPNDDLFQVTVNGAEHMISHPREINVIEENGQCSTIEVIDNDDIKHLITLKPLAELPD